MLTVRDVMNTNLQGISPEAPVQEAAKRMRDADIGVLPVMDDGNVIGMLTDRDLTVRVLADGLDASVILVEDVMTPDILSCQEEDSVEAAAETMADHQVHRLVVLNANRKPVGILSVGDLALQTEHAVDRAFGGIAERRHDEPGVERNH